MKPPRMSLAANPMVAPASPVTASYTTITESRWLSLGKRTSCKLHEYFTRSCANSTRMCEDTSPGITTELFGTEFPKKLMHGHTPLEQVRKSDKKKRSVND